MRWTMLCALAAYSLLHALASSDTTTTLTSTITVLTLTTTITPSDSAHASATTKTLSSTLIQTSSSGHNTPASSAGTTSAAAKTSATMSYQDDLRGAVLNGTNYYRNLHQADNLTWDSALADYAQNYAKKCIWEHSVLLSRGLSALT